MITLHPPFPNTLIVIAGPTATGKTAISIDLAHKLGTEIISADSRQVYKEMRIGTAAPGLDEMQGIKHYFIGNLSIHDSYDVSKYESDVSSLLKKLFIKYRYVIMTGGSGLYIDAVCKGIDELPDPDPELRLKLNNILKTNGITELQKRLKELDPDFYSSVDLMNPKRLIRSIEVCLLTGTTYSSLRVNKKKEHNFNVVKIGLNRDKSDLTDRINKRIIKMFGDGLMEEAQALYPYRHLNALNTVGYKELFSVLDGEITLDEAIEKIQTNTWRLAKRQLTWFRKDDSYSWFHPESGGAVLNYITDY